MLAKKIIIVISLLFSISLIAQNNDCTLMLKGKVLDSMDNSPLQFAHIELINGNKQANVVSKNGEFTIQNICKGIVELHISHLDCEHLDLKFFITKDTIITVNLLHIATEIGSAKINHKTEINNDLFKVSARQIELSKGLSIAEIMQGITGISLLKTGGSIAKPIVNGMHSNRVIILNNGIRQEGQNWGMEHAPEIDGFLTTDIQLLKGAEVFRYASDGIGGVVLVKPPSIFNYQAKKLKGELNTLYNSNGRGYGFSGIVGSKISDKIPLYWRMQATYKRNGNIRTPTYFMANTGAKEINFSAALGYENKRIKTELFYSNFNNQISIFRGSHIGNLSDLQKAFKSDTPLIRANFTYSLDRPYQLVNHQLLKANLDYILNAQNKLEINVAYQKNHRQEFDILRSANSNKGAVFNYYINTYMGDITFIHTNFHTLNYKIGVNGLRQANAYTGRFFIPGFYQNAFAAYFLADKTINRWKLETALRYDVKKLTSYLWRGNVLNIQPLLFHNATYLLQASSKLSKNTRITIGNSSAWRPPAPNELYSNGLHQGLASIEIGDSTLKPERSFHTQIAINYSTKKTALDIEIYQKYISNFINLIPSLPAQLTIRGTYPVFKFVQNNAAIYGINLAFTHTFKQYYFIKINSNALIGQNTSNNSPLAQMPPISFKFNLGFDHKKISVTPWIKYTFTQFRYLEGSDYLAPPKGFALIGADATCELKLKNKPFKLNFSVQNITNIKYREYLNRFRYFTNEPGFGITTRLIIPF